MFIIQYIQFHNFSYLFISKSNAGQPNMYWSESNPNMYVPLTIDSQTLDGIVISRFGLSATLNSISMLWEIFFRNYPDVIARYIQKTQTEYLVHTAWGILSDNVCCHLCRSGWRYKVCTVFVH